MSVNFKLIGHRLKMLLVKILTSRTLRIRLLSLFLF
jgi:hypothetical protein